MSRKFVTRSSARSFVKKVDGAILRPVPGSVVVGVAMSLRRRDPS